MSVQLPFSERPEGNTGPGFIQCIDPSLQEFQDSVTPSRGERKENLSNVKVPCDAQCGRLLPRSELKLCSRCRDARYCSQACQKVDWRAGHKAECGQGPPKDLALKLAERSLAVPKLVEHFWMMSILTLELLKDKSNAKRFAMKIVCDTFVADYVVAIQRMMSGLEKDPNAQVALKYEKVERVPLEDAPAFTQKIAKEVRETYEKDRRDAEGSYSPDDNPVIAVYFVSKEDPTGRDGAVSAAYAIPTWTLAYMENNPKSTFRSAISGDKEVDCDMWALLDGANALMRNDKQNKLRLRGYPREPRKTRDPSVLNTEELHPSPVKTDTELEVESSLSQLTIAPQDEAQPKGQLTASTD